MSDTVILHEQIAKVRSIIRGLPIKTLPPYQQDRCAEAIAALDRAARLIPSPPTPPLVHPAGN